MYPLVTTTRTIDTNGVRLHAETAGPETGPLVILLHGFPEHWIGFSKQIAPLADAGYFVVAPDQRGYNWSEKPKPVSAYTVETLAEDVTGIIDFFGRETATIIGHDWGGVVAWQVAIQNPARLDHMVVLNAPHPAAFLDALMNPFSLQLLRSWYIYVIQVPGLFETLVRLSGYNSLKTSLRKSSRPGTFSSIELDRYVEAWRQRGALTGMVNWYRAAVRRTIRMGKDRYEAASRVRVIIPTLILWGEQDIALVRELAPTSLVWCDSGSLVRFPGASHWLQHEEPNLVSKHILTFLGS